MRLANKRPVRLETREDGGRTLVGYAAVFYRSDDPGTEFELWDGYVERIMPGAFDSAIERGDDVRALFNHDSSLVLGRSTAGTMRLKSDDVGLRYEIDLPDTQQASDLATLVERGDVDGSSFAFTVTDYERSRDNEVDVREITGVRLFDVGPVTYPAYESTSVSVRASDVAEAKDEYEQWKQQQHTAQRQQDAVNVRARLLELDT